MDAQAVSRDTTALRITALVFTALSVAPRPADAQTTPLSEVLRDVGMYVEGYFSRVQHVIGVEKVTVQPVSRDLKNDGRTRNLVYELRLDWTPGAPADVRRELVRVDGRPSRPRDEAKCMDTAAITPEPLEFLLPENQGRYVFADTGSRTMDGRPVRTVSFRSRAAQRAKTSWKNGCGSLDPGRVNGRIWIDVSSNEVRRVDSGFVGRLEIRVPRDQPWTDTERDLTFERMDTSIRYRAVRFDDPDETFLLPATIDSLTLIRNATSFRVRHEYSGYRRFVTGGRIVE